MEGSRAGVHAADVLGLYTEMVGLRRFLWHGDVPQNERKKFLREPAELLMTTPESLEVMLVSPKVPVEELFKDLRCVVIDEIHATKSAEGVERVLLPGEREWALHRKAQAAGIVLPQDVIDKIAQAAAHVGINSPWEFKL